jgi:hypothetical protein
MPTYYLGLDAHKVRTQYCLVDLGGESLSGGSATPHPIACSRCSWSRLPPDITSATFLPASRSLILSAAAKRYVLRRASLG